VVVSVARRNLFQDKTRLLISVGGVAFSLLLILALNALVEGSLHQITAYIRNAPAQVFIAQPEVRTMHMSASSVPLETIDAVEAVPGVSRAVPILYTTNPVWAGSQRSLAYIIGFDPDSEYGGPWKVASGTAKVGRSEAVLDRLAADRMGVGLGDEVTIFGSPFVVAGLSDGTFTMTNSVAFIHFDDFASLRGLTSLASYLLVSLQPGVGQPEAVARISQAVPGVEVMTREEFAREEGRLVRDMSAQILIIMNSVGFVVGLMAVALTVYSLTVSRLKEYGVLKGLGAPRARLYRIVAEQAAWSVGLGLLAAVGVTLLLSLVFAWLLPAVPLRLTVRSVFQVSIGGLLIATLAAAAPIRRVSRLDPADVFRR
jgi:putative ABC transport system permease protein